MYGREYLREYLIYGGGDIMYGRGILCMAEEI